MLDNLPTIRYILFLDFSNCSNYVEELFIVITKYVCLKIMYFQLWCFNLQDNDLKNPEGKTGSRRAFVFF